MSEFCSLFADCCSGDWHCAYLLLYGPRPLTVLEDVEIKPAGDDDPTIPAAAKVEEKMET